MTTGRRARVILRRRNSARLMRSMRDHVVRFNPSPHDIARKTEQALRVAGGLK